MKEAPPKYVEFVCNLPPSIDPETWDDLGSCCSPRILVPSDQRFDRIGKSNNFTGPPHGNAFTEDIGIYVKPSRADLDAIEKATQ